MTMTEAFGSVADVLAAFAPEKIVDLKAPAPMSKRVNKLISLKKEGNISAEETLELERFLALNLFISLAKARARILLKA
jgi:hypothetical protein